ncbi:cysteine-rich receptor-like protein kinase 19 [Silene latifolia]|uniref:cysteine-rich receptor-like protein kinase 19 n=1 Tax=Silene latifolia TaxID=37657 RepID=UPI003D77061C
MVNIQLILLIFSFKISSTYGATASTKSHYISNSCQQNNLSTLAFQAELNSTLWNQLLPKASNLRFYNFTNGTSENQVYALFYCKGDIETRSCQGCIQAATSKITDSCKNQKEGIVWFEECTLRYADRNIFGIDEENPNFLYYNYSGIASQDRLGSYQDRFDTTMAALIQQAAYSNEKSGGFAIKEINLSLSVKLRGFAQCTPDIIGDSCYKCLKTALRVRDTWANTMVFLPSCFLRYDVYGTAEPLSPPPPPPPSHRSLQARSIIPIVVCSVVFILLAVIGGLWLWKRKSRKQGSEPVIPDSPSIVNEEKVQGFRKYSPPIVTEEKEQKVQGFRKYTFSQLHQMTNGFMDQLGKGAFGVVYHGYLLDGSREVAVKVLNERDAPRQFHNEIDVFGKISHKNLVSLLGYCEDGPKLALVYEFMNQGDLRGHLSGSLSWAKRLEIAIGTAEGLHYLHDHCEEHIVHRDVKPDNILLTGEGELLQAKVADFGISKIFPAADVTTLQTRIMGSHGYTAPEYYTTGLLNEKADVYSFGVVLLELITGISPRLGFNLVAYFDKMINAGDIEKILDTRLMRDRDLNYSSVWGATELARTCIEADQNKRPGMGDIVVKLKQCLDMQMKNVGSSSTWSSSMEMMPVMSPYTTTMYPQPR